MRSGKHARLVVGRTYCNSSNVEERLNSTPDVTPLQAAGDPVRHRILEALMGGSATQKALGETLQLQSGTLSKHIAKLKSAGLVVQRGGGHGPYEVQFRAEVARLLQANQNFLSARVNAEAAAVEAAGKRLNEAIMRPPAEASESEAG
jgi:DNA-binding MarR family transcriptional regulator